VGGVRGIAEARDARPWSSRPQRWAVLRRASTILPLKVLITALVSWILASISGNLIVRSTRERIIGALIAPIFLRCSALVFPAGHGVLIGVVRSVLLHIPHSSITMTLRQHLDPGRSGQLWHGRADEVRS